MLVGTAVSSQDPVQLQARLTAVTALLEERTSTVARLRAERDTANAEVEKLRVMIRQLLRAQYGRRSETLDPDQLQLGLERSSSRSVARKRRRQRQPSQRRHGSRRSATAVRCRGICRATR